MRVDHIDGDRGNDSLCNLQLVTNQRNCQLGSPQLSAANTNGYPNVYRMHNGTWYGQFRHGYKRVHCGTHKTPEAAYAAVLARRAEYGAETRRVAVAGPGPASR
ncbi:hypothetical protein Axy09_017 [Achromobacter phage vB_AxyP_19-32_Axy09]|uniref:HNH nuclease domain-containing protein n=1 Tax=Achromobacter phage vB_AxyP_19-32_Axy09 TaxID=2591040 RepID=A0A514CTX0_9CAUD|nr:hypothetical protein Axy09_017 [Achromobacter phage vB_AxyP_19-32_Axy09]